MKVLVWKLLKMNLIKMDQAVLGNIQKNFTTYKVICLHGLIPYCQKVASTNCTYKNYIFFVGAFAVKECSWNAYPYTRTKITISSLPKFSISIETRFLSDPGLTNNVFDLTTDELDEIDYDQNIDHIDMCG